MGNDEISYCSPCSFDTSSIWRAVRSGRHCNRQLALYLAYDGVNIWQRECDADYYPIVYEVANTRTESAYYGCVVASSGVDYLVSPLGADALNDASVYAIRHSSSGVDAPFYRIYKDDTNKNFAYYRESGTFVVTSGMQSESPNFKFYNSTLDAFEPQYDLHGALTEYSLKDTLGIDDREYSLSHYTYLFKLSTNGRYFVSAYTKNQKMVLVKIDIRTGMRTEAPTGAAEMGGLVIGVVSNDGRYVFIDTMKYGTEIESRTIYDLNTCEYDGGCQARDLGAALGSDDPGSYFYDYAFRAKFNEDSSALTMWFFGGASLTISPLPIDDGRLEYLALGDSFSSGEGDTGINPATKKNYYRAHTDDDGYSVVDSYRVKLRPIEQCHVSTRSYPYKLANSMKLGAHWSGSEGDWGSVACSGALMADIAISSDEDNNKSEDYLGQAAGSDGKPRLQGHDHDSLKAEALNEMIPGRDRQIEFVKKYQPKAVTLTVGGNDVQFEKIIRACVQPAGIGGEWANTCSYANDDQKKANLAEAIKDRQQGLKDLYLKLLEAGGSDMKLYVLGYPVFVDDTVAQTNNAAINQAMCGSNVRLNFSERRMVAEATKYLNKITQAAAREVGAIYISTTDAFGDYKLCGKYSGKAVNGITGAVNNAESFHPNELGHAKLASRIWEATNDQSLLDYECNPSRHVTCPDFQHHTVATPEYFKSAEHRIKARLEAKMTDNVWVRGSKIFIQTMKNTLMADTASSPAVYSEKISLGVYMTDSEGILSQEIDVPSTIKPGYHTLEIDSTDIYGEPIKLWKIIEVRSEDPNDYDGDGIPNSQDDCTYIESVGVDADSDGIDDGCDPEVLDLSPYLSTTEAEVAVVGPSKSTIFDPVGARSSTLANDFQRELADKWNDIRREALNMKPIRQEGANRSWEEMVIGVVVFLTTLTISAILIRKKR